MTDSGDPALRRQRGDVYDVTTPQQFKALGHPTRTRLLLMLGHESATVSQLARRLAIAKGSVAHHLRVLVDAGIVHETERRQVRGGTERYFARTTERIRVVGPDEPAHAAVLMHTVADELAATDQTHALTVRTLHLTQQQAVELGARLVEIIDSLEDVGPVAPRFRAVVSVYESSGPEPG